MILEEETYLEHFGVKGMRWGQRRKQNRDSRTKRLNEGTATRRDKLIRDADLDRGRTEAIRKGDLEPMSKAQRVGIGVAAAILLAKGVMTLNQVRNSL